MSEFTIFLLHNQVNPSDNLFRYKPTTMSSTSDPSTSTSNPSEDYASRPGQKDKDEIPVAKDENVEEGGYEDAETADSDAQLGALFSLLLWLFRVVLTP